MKRLIALLAMAVAMATAPVHAKDEKVPATGATQATPAASTPATPAAPTPATPAGAAKAATPRVELLDINTASVDELKQLTGIGEVRAEAIVKGRPYRAKNELVDKKILTQSVYDKVKDRIIAKQK